MENDVLTQPAQNEQFNQTVETTCDEQQTAICKNYNTHTKQELLDSLEESINNQSIESLKVITESIKIAFYKRNKSDVETAKKAFMETGGIEEEFKLEPDDCEERLKQLLSTYRTKRNDFNANLQEQKEKNLATKLSIIESIKKLIELSESSEENTYNNFTELQGQWRTCGAVPKEALNGLWNDYHFHVENYYSIMKINRELRDLDYKKNLEQKIILCEEAEKLSLLATFVEASRQLQLLHDKWREIGPVSKDQKDEIWDRFKQASTIINKNHQQYFENLNAEQQRNLNIKEELCQKVEVILTQELTTRKQWDEQTQEILNIQNIWKTIGFAPKKENTKVYEQFRELCNKFFESKQCFYNALKEKFVNSLDIKTEISKQAQLLKESTDWAVTTNTIIALQKQWKEAGSVPSKESDAIWKEFRGACDYFFTQKGEHYKKLEEGYSGKIEAKKKIIETLTSFEEENPHTAIEKLKEIQKEWAQSGHLPAKIQNPLYQEYKEIIDNQFSKFKKGLTKLNFDNFKNKVSSNTSNDIYYEKDRLQRRLQKLESDISTLENNIGFFSKSKNAESLIKDIEGKISQTREDIIITKEKIKHLNQEEKKRTE